MSRVLEARPEGGTAPSWAPIVSPSFASSVDLRATTIPSPSPRSQRRTTEPRTTRRSRSHSHSHSHSPRRSNISRVASARNRERMVLRPFAGFARLTACSLAGDRRGAVGTTCSIARSVGAKLGRAVMATPLRQARSRTTGSAPSVRSESAAAGSATGVCVLEPGPDRPAVRHILRRDPCGSLRTAADRLPERPGQVSCSCCYCGLVRSAEERERRDSNPRPPA